MQHLTSILADIAPPNPNAVHYVTDAGRVTVPAALFWLEIALFAGALMMGVILLVRQRNAKALCLFAGMAALALGRVPELLAVLVTHSSAAKDVLVPVMPYAVWVRWLGPCFLLLCAVLMLWDRTGKVAKADAQ